MLESLKIRLSSGWNFRRILYLIMGSVVIWQSLSMHEYFMILPGIYFASMGVFAFGCASGNCLPNFPKQNANQGTTETEIEFEEVKTR